VSPATRKKRAQNRQTSAHTYPPTRLTPHPAQIFILSLSAPFIPQFFTAPLDATAPYWDYLIGNETEARAYAAAHDLGTDDIPAIATHLARLPKKNAKRARTVVVTQGTDPTVVAVASSVSGEGHGAKVEVQVKTFPVRKVGVKEICDTNGAGYVVPVSVPAGLVCFAVGVMTGSTYRACG